MPPAIPAILDPYFAEYAIGSLILITSVLAAPSTWLTLRHVYAELTGLAGEAHRRTIQDGRNGAEDVRSRQVVLVSFQRSFSLWSELGKKMVRSRLADNPEETSC